MTVAERFAGTEGAMVSVDADEVTVKLAMVLVLAQ